LSIQETAINGNGISRLSAHAVLSNRRPSNEVNKRGGVPGIRREGSRGGTTQAHGRDWGGAQELEYAFLQAKSGTKAEKMLAERAKRIVDFLPEKIRRVRAVAGLRLEGTACKSSREPNLESNPEGRRSPLYRCGAGSRRGQSINANKAIKKAASVPLCT